MSFQEEFSTNLDKYMEEENISCEQLAKVVNRQVCKVRAWRYGREVPRLELADLVAQELGLTLDELCHGRV